MTQRKGGSFSSDSFSVRSHIRGRSSPFSRVESARRTSSSSLLYRTRIVQSNFRVWQALKRAASLPFRLPKRYEQLSTTSNEMAGGLPRLGIDPCEECTTYWCCNPSPSLTAPEDDTESMHFFNALTRSPSCVCLIWTESAVGSETNKL